MFDFCVDKQLFGWYYNDTEQIFVMKTLRNGHFKAYILDKDTAQQQSRYEIQTEVSLW